MRYLKSIFIFLLISSWSAFASVREVALLDFKSAPAAKGAIEGSTVDVYSSEIVARSMRSHFKDGRFDGIGQFGATNTADHVGLPAVGMVIPSRKRGRRDETFPAMTISDQFRPGFETRSGAHCVEASYVPTWWLSREVEARRAIHFGTVAAIACEYGIPVSLLDAVITQESGYKFWAMSSAGAMGIMQIMPGTARMLGLALPFDPVANMRAGARYLRQQLDRFGRVDLALAAYNAGPDRRSLRAGYVPAIPETQNYVRTITANWARMARMGVETTDSEIRGIAALTAVHASGYRSVELVRYDGLNAANPM